MRTVVDIKKVGRKKVADISVAEVEHYILENGIVSHNTGQYYAADNIYIVGRQQNKEGADVSGYNFVLNVEKSRYVREKMKVPITVSFETGVNRWSGLLELALDTGHVTKPSNGWYTRPLIDTDGKKFREKDTNTGEFWIPVLTKTDFGSALKSAFQLSLSEMEENEKIDYETGEIIDSSDEDAAVY